MALAPGTRLGPYEVVALLGQGGMGAVYRARDSRLGRDVALKVVPPELADPDRLARFTQEARAAAALNHPHIVAVHDVGTAGVGGVDTPYVVSELLEGEPLRAVLTRGRLPVRTAAELGVQIARGLAAAHEQGIVHRDVKPENVWVTRDGTAKVLDFGLAKLRADGPAALEASTTIGGAGGGAGVGTGPGVVLGTVGYMAPEQVRGETVDHRADVFALGCVLYELLTGQRAFQAGTAVETLSAILNTEPPDLTTQVTGIGGGLERIVRRCLAKAPGQRFQSAKDLAFALEAVGETRSGSGDQPPSTRAVSRSTWWRVPAGVAAGAATGVATMWFAFAAGPATPPVAPPLLRFDVNLAAAGIGRATNPRVSPDGRSVVFRAAKRGIVKLHVWSAANGQITELMGSDGAFAPNWSHSGDYVYFRVSSALKRIAFGLSSPPADVPFDRLVLGGSVTVSTNVVGDVLLVDGRQRLMLLTRGAQAPRAIDLAVPNASAVSSAEFLPDGRRYLVTTTPSERAALYVATLDSPDVRLVQQGIEGRVAFVAPDILMFRRQTALMAQRIALESLTLQGEAVAVLPTVAPLSWSASAGLLAFLDSETSSRQFVWRDRSGASRPLGQPSRAATFDLSNDGRSLVVSQSDDTGQSLWVVDADLGGFTRVTPSGSLQEADPRWSPDGRRILYGSTRAPGRSPHLLTLGEATPAQVFAFPGALFSLDDWSRDGRWMVYHDANRPELYARGLEPGAEPVTVARGFSGTIDQAQVSPDSTQVAFNANDTGRFEVFVAPMQPGGQRIRISRAGGVQPTWRADGRELFFVGLDGVLMSVPVTPGTVPRFGVPVPLFSLESDEIASGTIESYLPAPDGRRFLVLQSVGNAPSPSLGVIANWQQLLPAQPGQQ